MPGLLWPLPRGVSSANDHSILCCYFTWPANGFINHLPCWPDKPLRASSNYPRPVSNLSLTWSEIPLLLVWTPEHLLFSFCPADSGPYQTSFHTRSGSHGGTGGSQPLSGRWQQRAQQQMAAQEAGQPFRPAPWPARPLQRAPLRPRVDTNAYTHSPLPSRPRGFLKLELNRDQKTSFNWLHNRLHWYHTPMPTHKRYFQVFFLAAAN